MVLRYVKLLLSYQFMFILAFVFAPLSYDRFAVYGEDLPNAVMYFLIDFFGCASVLGTPTYNATWWYMSLALTFIAILPMLKTPCKKYGYILLPALFFVLRYFNTYFTVSWYFPVAVLGMLCAQEHLIERIVLYFDDSSVFAKLSVLLPMLVIGAVLLWLRYKTTFCWDVIDLIITFFLVLFVCIILNKIPVVSHALAYIGKYSMNIFLLHTFIFYHWFREHVYSFKYPVLILTVLLFESLVASFCVERVKSKIHFDAFSRKISDYIVQFLYNTKKV